MALNVRLNDAQQAVILRRMDELERALTENLPLHEIIARYRRARATLDTTFGTVATTYQEMPTTSPRSTGRLTEDLVVSYVQEYSEQAGHPPTAREISEGTGRAQKAVNDAIKRLVTSGRLEQGQGMRSLTVPR